MKLRKAFITTLIFISVSTHVQSKVKVLRDVPSTLVYPLRGHTPFGIHRGTSFWLDVLTGGKTTFSEPQDLAVARLFSTDDPRDSTDDVLVTVWGLNSGRGEIIYNVGTTHLKVFGEVGVESGQFSDPTGLAGDTEGRLLVADTGNDRVVELRDDGKVLKFVRILAPVRDGPTLKGPTYCALDKDGRLYLSDTGNRRVLLLGRRGNLVRIVWQGKGSPRGLCYAEPGMEWFTPAEALLYVVIRRDEKTGGGFDLLRLDPKGRVVREVELPALGAPFGAIDLDYYGNVYVVATGGNQILKYSPDLELLDSVGREGKGDYKFRNPTGIAIWRRFGQVFVSEAGGAHYFWIGADAKNIDLKISGSKKRAVVSMTLTERALVSGEWVGPKKRALEKVPILPETELLSGSQALDFSLPENREVLDKDLKFRLRLMATYSSRNRLAKEFILSPQWTPATYP